MFAIGVNPWIWTSPITDEALASLLPRFSAWGFDAVELPVENLGDWSPSAVADLLAAHGLSAAAVIAVTPPGRELVVTDDATVPPSRGGDHRDFRENVAKHQPEAATSPKSR